MSEYQYYEFRAIDQPLTDAQIRELGQYSSRAEITATTFANEYNYGSFRGDVTEFLNRYFDAFVYVANWGTRRFAFRVPEGTIDFDEARRYCPGEEVAVRRSRENLVFDISSHDEGGGWEEGEGWMQRLVPLREELIAGDRRLLYLAWLVLAESGKSEYGEGIDPKAKEPPVPPGLKKLTAAQKQFVEFMRLDADLLSAAAEASVDLPAAGKGGGESSVLSASRWVASLPQAEKEAVLVALCAGTDPAAGTKLRRRFQQAMTRQSAAPGAAGKARTVAELRRAADEAGEREQQAEARRAAEAQAEREAAEAAAKAARQAVLAKNPEKAWIDVERLIAEKKPEAYDNAVTILCDLRDLALPLGPEQSESFRQRVVALRKKFASRQSLLKKMTAADLKGKG